MNIQGPETATVLKTDGGQATVITNRSSSCRECGKAQAGICGKSGSGMVLKVRNPAGARNGDTVEIGIDKGTHIRGYIIVFVLPMAVLLLSAYAGHLISAVSGYGGLEVTAGLLGLVISLLYSVRKIYLLERASDLYIRRVLHDTPEYRVGSSPEEIDYLQGFGAMKH